MTLMSLLLLCCTSTLKANICNGPSSNNNKLIKSSHRFTDTKPYFKKSKIYSYKAGTWDIDQDEFSVNSFGNKLNMTGNSWKMVKFPTPYTLTQNSVLEFEFISQGEQLEVNGIGLIMKGESSFIGSRFFQIHGTQTVTSYNQEYNNYPGTKWKKYQIPLWDSTSNTNEKRVDLLVFAADDDNPQANQNISYKNVTIIENISEYNFPEGFEHFPVEIKPSNNKNFLFHMYAQKITGPDGNDYPVSDGSIILKYYSPPNSNTQYLISAKEQYYENMCWESNSFYGQSSRAPGSMSRLQKIAINEEVPGFLNVPENKLNQSVKSYFDPDFKLPENTNFTIKKPTFIHEFQIRSANHIGIYVDKTSAHDGKLILNGFAYNVANGPGTYNIPCGSANSGMDTSGNCHDLTNLTELPPGSNEYISVNDFATVKDAEGEGNPYTPGIMTDIDNIWDESSVKRQATETLVITKAFDDFVRSLSGQSYVDITGWKLNAIINSSIAPSFQTQRDDQEPYDPFVYFRKENTPGWGGHYLTETKSHTTIGHEFSHGLTHIWFNGSLATNDVQGCAINEGFADVMGLGLRYFDTGSYIPIVFLDQVVGSNTVLPGMRNVSTPADTFNHSVFRGNNEPSDSCTGGSARPCNNTGSSGSCPDFRSINDGYHSVGVVIGHLFHIMTNNSGFANKNADSTFRPDNFGVAPDETFTYQFALKLFYSAMQSNQNPSNSGSIYTFCDFRDDMIGLGSNNSRQRTAIQQAWKHVYQDLLTICPIDSNLLLFPEIEITSENEPSIIIPNGGEFHLGEVEAGSDVVQTLRILNPGEYPLRLVNPIISNDDFSLTGINENEPVTVFEENVNSQDDQFHSIQVKYDATSVQQGYKSASLTFETNLPNGTNNQHFFTIYLSAYVTESQGIGDAYEDDDTLATASQMTNFSLQDRNFEDDDSDFINLQSLQIPGAKMSCGLGIVNTGSTRNLCIHRYNNENVLIDSDCDLISTNGGKGIPYFNCSGQNPNQNCEIYNIQIENIDSQRNNSSYNIEHDCIFFP